MEDRAHASFAVLTGCAGLVRRLSVEDLVDEEVGMCTERTGDVHRHIQADARDPLARIKFSFVLLERLAIVLHCYLRSDPTEAPASLGT